MAISKPTLPPKSGYVEIVINGEHVYKNVKTGKIGLPTGTEENIKALKQQLADTDYQAIKYAEGWITEEEYAPIKEQRQAWREQINELEAQLAS